MLAQMAVTEVMIFRENLGARIAFCVDKIGKKGDAASFAGVSPEQLNKWIKGTVKVPVEALRVVAQAANVDFSWLATGEGIAPPGGPIQIGFAGEFMDPADTVAFNEPGMIAIPRYDEVRPSAGPGSTAGDEQLSTRVAVERRWLGDIGVQTSAAVILAAQGDSMEPTIRNGSPMLIDTSKKEVRHGFIYVFDVDGDLMVKRVARLPDGSFDLISDNRNYPVRNLSRDTVTSLTVIGRVYAALSKF